MIIITDLSYVLLNTVKIIEKIIIKHVVVVVAVIVVTLVALYNFCSSSRRCRRARLARSRGDKQENKKRETTN